MLVAARETLKIRDMLALSSKPLQPQLRVCSRGPQAGHDMYPARDLSRAISRVGNMLENRVKGLPFVSAVSVLHTNMSMNIIPQTFKPDWKAKKSGLA
jgi:hypothetical protein